MASPLVPAASRSSECRDTARGTRAHPRSPAGTAGAPPLGGPLRSRRQKRRERYARLAARDPYDPENLLVALDFEREQRTPAERLVIAILEDAIRSYVRTAHARSFKQKQLFVSTRDWIAACDRSWIFSFESICDVLDLDANRIRRRLRAWKLAHQA